MARKTQEELLADAQARVAALEAKAEGKRQKQIDELHDRRERLVKRITTDTNLVQDIDTQLIELGYEWPTVEEPAYAEAYPEAARA